MQEEIWKDIPDYEGFYQVSNFGRVKGLDRKSWNGKVFFNKTGIVLKLKLNRNGYYTVNLCKSNLKKTLRVHQLVAVAFLNHKIDGFKIVVDHIDGDKKNNNVSNLQLISMRENISRSRKNGTSKYTGVCFDKYSNKWKSTIGINGKNKHLGNFKNEYDAHLAYQNALKNLENG